MWVERRRGRSDGSPGVRWVGLLGLGGGESEKMSERGLGVSVGDGGVEGGVEDMFWVGGVVEVCVGLCGRVFVCRWGTFGWWHASR